MSNKEWDLKSYNQSVEVNEKDVHLRGKSIKFVHIRDDEWQCTVDGETLKSIQSIRECQCSLDSLEDAFDEIPSAFC
jgi:hypothetical protein